MLTLNDGRNELWQWDTGRKLEVDVDCSQVHFSNKVFGRSIDVDVVDGVATIPDILLQTDKELNVWAFAGTAENGYTKISKTFKVNRRNKPADYVFTQTEQTSLEEIKEKIEYLESIQDPDAIKNAVEDYLEQNPVDAPVQSVNGKTGKVSLTALDVGAISQDDLQEATNEALAQAKASGEFNGKDGQDYVLTNDDKTEIAEMAADLVEVPDSGGNADQSGVYYIATDHGVRPDVEDNTAAMQDLIDKVHENGGGIIWLPIGEYRFDSANSVPENSDFRTILTPKSGVSIIGESLSGTVIQVYGHTEKGASWLANYIADRDDKSVKLSGCTYRNFTIDMSEATVAEYSSTGKALGMKALRDCIFRDLRLLNTPSTALGIDMLDNVVIDSVYVYRGGREWQPGGQGGAGIGIGTGKWENENYVVRNCLCVECGRFGIFLEDQGIFSSNQQNYPEGLTITNNVVRNGRNYGIGVRGGRNVIITGNNLYGNKGGIYLDYGAKNVLASNNVIADCTEAGLLFGIEDAGFGNYPCESVAVLCNSFFDNKLGISTALRMPINSEFTSNIFIGNDSNMTVEIPIEESRIKQGVYINDAGEEAANDISWLYDAFLDLDTTLITWTPIGETETGDLKNPRIAIYDENKGFLHRINGDYQPDKLKTIIEEALTAAGKSTNFRYIKFGDNCRGEILTTLHLYSLK